MALCFVPSRCNSCRRARPRISIGSFAFRRSFFFFRTRPGFHKILDPFFPYWTKQVWQSTLFYKQMVTSFFQIEKAINWGSMEFKYFAPQFQRPWWRGEKDVLYFQKIESSAKQPIMQHVLSEILKQFCCLKNSFSHCWQWTIKTVFPIFLSRLVEQGHNSFELPALCKDIHCSITVCDSSWMDGVPKN